MKTFFNHLLVQFEAMTHPAGGMFKINATEKKKRNQKKMVAVAILSPDCFNVRGGAAKSSEYRRTPAP